MAAAIHNFSIESGSNFSITFQYLDINENPIDLTGYCATLLMRGTQGPPTAYGFSSNNSSASLITNGWTLLLDQSNIVFALSYTETSKIQWTEGVYDLYITEFSTPEKKTRIATGIVTIIPNNFPSCADEKCGTECIGVLNSSFITPTPTPGLSVTPTPTPLPNTGGETGPDLCERFCNGLDIDAVMYVGTGLIIPDNSITSGTITIGANDNRILQNIELMINKLKHPYPQDLALILVPPTGNKILLSGNDKIKNNDPINGFSYIISNKAAPGVYINNVLNNSQNIPYVNIFDKTNKYNFNNETLVSDITSWIGSSPSGDWTLIIRDDDIDASGTIEDWRLIMTYEPLPLTVDPLC